MEEMFMMFWGDPFGKRASYRDRVLDISWNDGRSRFDRNSVFTVLRVS